MVSPQQHPAESVSPTLQGLFAVECWGERDAPRAAVIQLMQYADD